MPDPFESNLRSLLEIAADRADYPTADHLHGRLSARHVHRTARRRLVAVSAAAVAVILLSALIWLPRTGRSAPDAPAGTSPAPSAALPACVRVLEPTAWFLLQPVIGLSGHYELPAGATLPLVSYVPVSASVCRYAPGDDPKQSPYALTATAVATTAQRSALVSALNSLPDPWWRQTCPYDHGALDVIHLLRPDGTVQTIQRHRLGCGTVSDGVRYHHDTVDLMAAVDAVLPTGH